MPSLHKNDVLTANGRSWTTVRKLGEGQFAEVFEARDVEDYTRRYAIKIEKGVRILKVEHRALTALQHVPEVCRLHDQGVHADKVFLVLELLGCNLAEYRRAACTETGGRFALPDVKVLGSALLRVLEGMHRAGWIHRDVKPANFCLLRQPKNNPPSTSHPHGVWRAIDFGLARKHMDEQGVPFPARPDAAFRGSRAYASVHAHQDSDLGRRDDLWSWFYMLVELSQGGLPWREVQSDADKDSVLLRKQAALDDPHTMAAPGETLPAALVRVHAYIKTLDYADNPDYDHLQSLLALTQEEQLALHPSAHTHTPMVRGGSWGATEPTAAATNGAHTPMAAHHLPTPCVAAAPHATGGAASCPPPPPPPPPHPSHHHGAGAAPPPRQPSTSQGPRPPPPASVPKLPEPSKAAALAANIMQSSAAARKALEAQREAAKQQQQVKAGSGTGGFSDPAADVKQLLSSLSASMAGPKQALKRPASPADASTSKKAKAGAGPQPAAPPAVKPPPADKDTKPESTATTPCAVAAAEEPPTTSLGVKLRPRSSRLQRYHMADVATSSSSDPSSEGDSEDDRLPLHAVAQGRGAAVKGGRGRGRGRGSVKGKRESTPVACTGLPSVHAGRAAFVQSVEEALGSMEAGGAVVLSDEQRMALEVVTRADFPARFMMAASVAASIAPGSELDGAGAVEFLEGLAAFSSSRAAKHKRTAKR